MRLSHLTLSTFTNCRRKYYFSRIERLEPKELKISMRTGKLVHFALEKLYKGLKEGNEIDLDDLLKLVEERFREQVWRMIELGVMVDDDKMEEDLEKIKGIIKHYYRNAYQRDRERLEVLAVELPFAFQVKVMRSEKSHKSKTFANFKVSERKVYQVVCGGDYQDLWGRTMEGRRNGRTVGFDRGVWYSGIIDLVAYDKEDGRFKIIEHKVGANPNEYRYRVTFSDQHVGYYLGALLWLVEHGHVDSLEEARSRLDVVYNIVRRKAPSRPRVVKCKHCRGKGYTKEGQCTECEGIGYVLSSARSDTDYHTALEVITENGLPLDKYSEFLEELRGKDTFNERFSEYVSEDQVLYFLRFLVHVHGEIKRAHELARKGEEDTLQVFLYPAHSWNCANCIYRDLCREDTPAMREALFTVREYRRDEDEDQETDQGDGEGTLTLGSL